MNVFLVQHVSHASKPKCGSRPDDVVSINEELGDDVKLLGCYSSVERAEDRIARARSLPGFTDEPECFIVDRYEIDRDEWPEGFVSLPS